MLSKRLASVVCLATLLCSVSTSVAEDPGWSGNIANPAGTTVAVGGIQISGTFTKQFYSPSCDRVRIKVVKGGSINPAFLSATAMTSNGATSTTFDTNSLPILQRPNIPEAGTYTITVTAVKDDGMGGEIIRKTLTKTVTAQ